jgi:beta-lactamase regulating signal transducer with metallopeptidase domain
MITGGKKNKFFRLRKGVVIYMYLFFTKLLNMSFLAGMLVFAVIFLRIVLKKTPKKMVCILWVLVAFRLICPFSVSSSLSVFNLLNTGEDSESKMEYFQYNEKTGKPTLTFKVSVLTDDNVSADSITDGIHSAEMYLPTVMFIWGGGRSCNISICVD